MCPSINRKAKRWINENVQAKFKIMSVSDIDTMSDTCEIQITTIRKWYFHLYNEAVSRVYHGVPKHGGKRCQFQYETLLSTLSLSSIAINSSRNKICSSMRSKTVIFRLHRQKILTIFAAHNQNVTKRSVVNSPNPIFYTCDNLVSRSVDKKST